MNTNQQVRGTYEGQAFSGVISSMRRLSVKTDGCFEFMVELSAPVTVYGEKRTGLCVCAKFDGSPSNYTGFNHSIEAA